MALNNGLRSIAKQLIATSESTLLLKPGTRGLHSTGVKRMGGGHGHGDDYEYYLHAKHMYNLDRMKYQKVKIPLAVFTAFSIGVLVPVYAVIFQQKKTASA
ncbi:TonB-dependent heme receptor A [Parasponia andersonii]|uniref:TonB-dependent heme receptor A n=1 Tax=Parasponia andersonii TaxID=3476 RepID=A0A2P5ANE1_PARAD|nr:TonB-dependent heme receptor A [Parasponia andersonii]